ncbi:MAG: hypothetical protein HC805_00065 [Alkalinema sp. RL_2_19]|nr:hypothetical protein [Alkalinema sp. RL_2_19]
MNTYLQGIRQVNSPLAASTVHNSTVHNSTVHSLLITGSEMSASERSRLHQTSQHLPHTKLIEFTDDLMSYIRAADMVVCMGGYNTITEVLAESKPAIVIPRTSPGYEQLIRAQQMDRCGWLHCLHPNQLSPQRLNQALHSVLQRMETSTQLGMPSEIPLGLNFDGLAQVTQHIQTLLWPQLPTTIRDRVTEFTPRSVLSQAV